MLSPVSPGWRITNPYGNHYQLEPGVWAYHTGIDLVASRPGLTAHAPIVAADNGIVIYARRVLSTWGNLIIQDCGIPGIYLRYAHVETIGIEEGQQVSIGQHIANVGNAYGAFAYHLHFDVADDILKTKPTDWPGLNLSYLHSHYFDPQKFIGKYMSPEDTLLSIKTQLQVIIQNIDLTLSQDNTPATGTLMYSITDHLNVRATPSTKGEYVGSFSKGAVVHVVDDVTADGYTWAKLTDTVYAGNYVAKNFLSTTAPK